MLLAGKFVIVSGIGPGLGTKLAVHAAIEGAAGVAIGGRTPAKLDEAEAAVRATGTDCQVVKTVVDIRQDAQCEVFVAEAMAAFGRVDALINNAVLHGPMGQRVEEGDLDLWLQQYETNVLGTIRMTRAAAAPMKAVGAGAVVMISTMGVKMVPISQEAGYCASKAALYNATRKLVTELGPQGIRVNTLHPGWMWGAPVQNHMASDPARWGSVEEGYAKIAAIHSLRRIPTDDECARAALFLASDYASACAGASLDANGGNLLP